MNATEQTILALLQTKFAGVSDAVLNRIAIKLAKTATSDDAATNAVNALTWQQVIDSYADARANEATQTAVSNYEKKYNLHDGKAAEAADGFKPDAQPQQKPDEAGKGGNSELATQLAELLKPLTERLSTLEQDKVAETRQSKLNETLSDAPAIYKKQISDNFGRLKFADDSDYNTWLESVKADKDAFVQAMKEAGATFTVPAGGNNTPQATEIPATIAEAIKERTTADTKDKKSY